MRDARNSQDIEPLHRLFYFLIISETFYPLQTSKFYGTSIKPIAVIRNMAKPCINIWFSWIRPFLFYQRPISSVNFLLVSRKPSWLTGIKYFEQSRQPLDNFTKLVKAGHEEYKLSLEALLACISWWLVCQYFPFVLRQQRTNSDNYPSGKVHLWGIYECIVGWVSISFLHM